MIDLFLRLRYWLSKAMIEPETVKVTIEFKNEYDQARAEAELMKEAIYCVRPASPPTPTMIAGVKLQFKTRLPLAPVYPPEWD